MIKFDNGIKVITAAEDRELVKSANERVSSHWPEFMLHDSASRLFPDLYEKLPDFQFTLVDKNNNQPMAIGNSIPLRWENEIDNLPDEGWRWALESGIADHERDVKPNILCALQIVIFKEFRSQNLSQWAVRGMKLNGEQHGLRGLIAPVRPSAKPEYPLIPIGDYIKYTRDDGKLFDPWLRVHANVGARIVRVSYGAMYITGTVDEWKSWTGIDFDFDGEVSVPGALNPVIVDLAADRIDYHEPNVWMYHPPSDEL